MSTVDSTASSYVQTCERFFIYEIIEESQKVFTAGRHVKPQKLLFHSL